MSRVQHSENPQNAVNVLGGIRETEYSELNKLSEEVGSALDPC